jgi:hypothetical protein
LFQKDLALLDDVLYSSAPRFLCPEL